MSRILFAGLLIAAVLVATIWAGNLGMGPLVINREAEYRVVLRFGKPVGVMREPSWRLRVPMLDSVRIFDARLQYLDAQPVEKMISGGDRLIVDYYVVWRIGDPLEFMKSFPLGMEKAEHRIQSIVHARVGDAIGGLTLSQLLERAEILDHLAEESNAELAEKGVQVVDVRLNRTELPRKAEPAAYEQMREQRRAISRAERARGEREARTIRAEADRDARTTRAKAQADSEILRGEGDAESARIYAEAYNRDPEFYAFVRSLEAYRKSLGDRTTVVLPPDHEFFRFLNPQDGSGKGMGGSARNSSEAPDAQAGK
jgi:membrane protease subunit HflC